MNAPRLIILTTVFTSLKQTSSFHEHVPYMIQMYYHQNLVLSGNRTSHKALVHLEISDGKKTIIDRVDQFPGHRTKRRKRLRRHNKNNNENIGKENLDFYGNDHQYQGDFEAPSGGHQENYEYDYGKFKNEYYHEINTKKASTERVVYKEYYDSDDTTAEPKPGKYTTDITKTSDVPMENYCSVLLLFRVRVFECLYYGFKTGNIKIKTNASYVILFWLSLYGIFAAYLWCSRGWCCCCCPCSSCHPHHVIKDARQFLQENPPGIIKLKRLGDKATYTSTEYEETCYRELEEEVFNF